MDLGADQPANRGSYSQPVDILWIKTFSLELEIRYGSGRQETQGHHQAKGVKSNRPNGVIRIQGRHNLFRLIIKVIRLTLKLFFELSITRSNASYTKRQTRREAGTQSQGSPQRRPSCRSF